jgi:hypothetical protein
MMLDNTYGREQMGAAKNGSALLAGILRCRRCGRKLMVRYTGKRHDILRYACYRAWLDNGEPPCIGFGGLPTDEAISREIVRVVQPAGVQAAVIAAEQQSYEDDQVLHAWEREREAARYAAHRAQKQYDLADPENRLVADELERRWNEALRRVQDAEQRIDQHNRQQVALVRPTKQDFECLAGDLEAVWNSPTTDARLKKRIVRTLIHEVIADVDPDRGALILTIHWKGGIHTELHLHDRRRGSGLRTGRGNRWIKERVTSLRSHHEIPRHTAERQQAEGWMNLTQAADFLHINSTTLRMALERGEIQAEHPFPGGPWIINRRILEAETAQKLAARVHFREHTPAKPMTDQATLDLSDT